jgi:hypothetical protein
MFANEPWVWSESTLFLNFKSFGYLGFFIGEQQGCDILSHMPTTPYNTYTLWRNPVAGGDGSRVHFHVTPPNPSMPGTHKQWVTVESCAAFTLIVNCDWLQPAFPLRTYQSLHLPVPSGRQVWEHLLSQGWQPF